MRTSTFDPKSASTTLLATVFLALGLLTPFASLAQQSQGNPCDNEVFLQFDFWVGEWTVTQKDGSYAGTNRIEKILNGCVLQENWTGTGGSIGKSFNTYDWQTKQWKQNWVDGAGGRIDIAGGLEGESMVMRGTRPARTGEGTVLNEIKWTPKPDGSVEQHWRVSQDGGKTWTDAFLGIYRRK